MKIAYQSFKYIFKTKSLEMADAPRHAWQVYTHMYTYVCVNTHTYIYVCTYLTHSKGRSRFRGQYSEQNEAVYFRLQRDCLGR